jgi:hypothetical protein
MNVEKILSSIDIIKNIVPQIAVSRQQIKGSGANITKLVNVCRARSVYVFDQDAILF